MLLCTIDALAPRDLNKSYQVKKRFVGFLEDRIKNSPGLKVRLLSLKVPSTGKMLSLAEVLYEYLRNPIVHAGDTLDVSDNQFVSHVYLDWHDPHLASNVDNERNRVVLGAYWVVSMLKQIITDEFKKA